MGKFKKNMHGLSVVEILVALVVGMFLMAGILQVYVSNHNAARTITGFSFQQENARVAVSNLADALLLAGHFGSVKGNDISVIGGLSISGVGSCNHSWAVDTGEAIRGFDGADAVSSVSGLPSGCIDASHYVTNSDIVVVRYGAAMDMSPIGSLTSSKVYLRSAVSGDFSGGEILLGSDSGLTQLGGGADGVGIYNYAYKTEMFYLRPCAELNGTSCTDGIQTLVRLGLDGTTLSVDPVAEGVEQFQLKYGEDLDGDYIVDQYEDADSVSDWNNILSVRFSLVVRSTNADMSVNDTATYSLLDDFDYTPATSDSQYVRKVYTRVVQLRNMSRG